MSFNEWLPVTVEEGGDFEAWKEQKRDCLKSLDSLFGIEVSHVFILHDHKNLYSRPEQHRPLCFKIYIDQEQIHPARLGREILVILSSQVSLRVHYCKRDEVYFTTLLWQNNGHQNSVIYCECYFPNCTKSWWIQLLPQVSGAAITMMRLDGARGKKQVWRARVWTWALSEANLLYGRKYFWHFWDFTAYPQWFGALRNDSAPG